MAALVPPKAVNAPARAATPAATPAVAAAPAVARPRDVSSPRLRGRAKGTGGSASAPRMPNAARFRNAAQPASGGGQALSRSRRAMRKASRTAQGRAATPEAEGMVAGIARSPKTPAADPAFQVAKRRVSNEARRQRNHPLPDTKREEAENASAMTAGEQVEQSGKENSTDGMQRVGKAQQAAGRRFSADSFKQELLAKVGGLKPRSESDAKAMAKQPPLGHFEQGFSGKLAAEQGAVTGPLEQQAAAGPRDGQVEKDPAIELPKPRPAPRPMPVDPSLAAPKARTEAEVSQQKEVDRLDGAMAKNRLDDNQLANSREPSFIETLKKKQEARKRALETPAVYRTREAGLLQSAQARTDQTVAGGLGSMAGKHGRIGGQVHGGQSATETQTERRQREIKGRIDDIYKGTVNAVKGVLEAMATQVKQDFANTLKDQTDSFNEKVRARISDYYGDWRIDDDLFGPADVVVNEDGTTRAMTFEESFGRKSVKSINPDVYQIFLEEKDRFLGAMNQALDNIARSVEAGLDAAQAQIELGQALITIFKATLKGDELTYANQLEEEVRMRFANLEATIDDTRNDLLESMAEQYSESVAGLEKSFNEINDELKKSWIDRAIEFVETVGRTIFQLAELLLSILVRMANLIWDIVKHPIRFFETLVAGLMQGIGDFISNIGTYLQEAFWTWITGTSAAKGIKVSSGSGADSLFGIVLQVLSLTPADLRGIVDKVLGPEFMQMVDKGMAAGEKALEPVLILLNKGPGALWEYIKDSLASIIKSTFERIKESVFFAFVEKGIKWVAGFFIPGGGFVKIIKAVFRAFQFVADNLENIRHFFDSVFDSMEAATQGRTDGVAAKILTGLKAGVVLALDFLAKQLGLDKIVNSVQGIIKSLRRPIVGAIEWLLGKVKPFALGIVAAVNKATIKVTSAAKAVFSWAFARAGFKDADGAQHSVYVQGEDNPRLMIASDPKSAEDFVHWYVGSKSKQFAQDNARQIGIILSLIENSKTIVREIVGLKKNGAAWKDRQRALLDANVALSNELSKLVDDDPALGKKAEKYKLEGMTGTYGSMPKPTGDDFTADHQPQAAIIVAASKFRYFSKTGELAEHAETRAKAGYSINLYKKRHEAGRTYGMKGKHTKEDFIAEVKPRVRDLPAAEQRAEVIRLMKAAMRRDAAAIKSVVRAKYDSPIWDDVRAAVGKKKTQEQVGEIRTRINNGEDQILNQDLDSLTG